MKNKFMFSKYSFAPTIVSVLLVCFYIWGTALINGYLQARALITNNYMPIYLVNGLITFCLLILLRIMLAFSRRNNFKGVITVDLAAVMAFIILILFWVCVKTTYKSALLLDRVYLIAVGFSLLSIVRRAKS